MNFIKLSLSILLISFLCCCKVKHPQNLDQDFTQFVDPYIGSDYHGHIFVGANVPFGAVQLGPNNKTQGWDWCSGYHYSDSVLIGFAHTHLSGTGIGDLGDIIFMPVSDQYSYTKGIKDEFNWESTYSHDKESVEPGFYSVHIDRYNIDAYLTSTERVGVHKYIYNNSKEINLIIDLRYGTGWDQLIKGSIKQVNSNSIRGYRYSKGWAKDQKIFFYTEFSKKIESIETINSNKEQGKTTVLIKFKGSKNLLAKTAISPVSEKGAKSNLITEMNHWDFNNIKNRAKEKWNNELSKIKIETESITDKRTFYTALYHTMIAPSIFNDANGDYRGADQQIHNANNFTNYTTFSLWDTYRAAHPLFTIMHPERVSDFINTMLAIYKQQGKLPIWHLHGNETNTMVGYSAVPVIADAYLKGIKGFDADLAFEAMKKSALLDERGQDYVKSKGYIPADTQVESVARALEYAISDWAIAAMAKKLEKNNDAELFSNRAKYYKNYFDHSTKFMRGKLSDGSWRKPFNPISSQHRNDDYCEGNAWQYTWLVPQDVEGLIKLLGGDDFFVTKLDSLFSIESIKVEGASADISGLIGQYAHGNEPSHHISYLYTYAGQQWKTAEKVREICTTMYTDQPDGLCGNEDCGQMSAWYIFSSIGFYPVNPSNGAYIFGSPLFDKIKLSLPDNKKFNIVVQNNSHKNIYIQNIQLNGKIYNKSYITHKDIMNGGELIITMGNKPNTNFGTKKKNRPQSTVY